MNKKLNFISLQVVIVVLVMFLILPCWGQIRNSYNTGVNMAVFLVCMYSLGKVSGVY